MDKEKGATAPLKSKKSGKPGAKKKKQQMKTVENDQQDNAVYQELIEMAERFFIDQYHASIIEEEVRRDMFLYLNDIVVLADLNMIYRNVE